MGVTTRLHITISGRVQGVGFRYFVYREAIQLGVTGWVRNLPDGKVEAEFEGSRDTLEQLLEKCQKGPPLAVVTRVETRWEEGAPIHKAFSIRG